MGDGADWLRAHARPGAAVVVKTRISADGAALAGKTGVVNGGPRLLSGGSVDITAYAEGFVWPDDPEFYYRFGIKRNPRTIAGITPAGDLLLVAVDGHRPGYSVGASFREEAAIMDSLGAEEAVNLDNHDPGKPARDPPLGPNRRASHRGRGGTAPLSQQLHPEGPKAVS